MALFHSCCLCCNLRTGSFISGIYSVVATIFYLILLIIRNIGFELVDKYSIHASLTYAGIGVLTMFIVASVILVIGVPLDKVLMYVMWAVMAPVCLVYSTIALCLIIVYDLQNNVPVEGWEQALIGVHAINTIFMIMCMTCVYSQFYDLYRGKGTADYYNNIELAREQTLATMFGLDMGLGDDDLVGATGPADPEGPVRPVGPLDPPAYPGVPPPAYSDLSSRRTQQQTTGASTNSQSGDAAENNTSGNERANQQPQSNPVSDNNTPASTVRSQESARARARPRPAHRPPPSDIGSVDSMGTSTGRGAGSLVYLNFDLESEDGRSTTSRPTTLLRDEAVARVMVNNTLTESETQDPETQNATSGSHGDNNNTRNAQNSGESGSRQGQSESGSRSSGESRSRRVREGLTRDGSNTRSNSESRGNNDNSRSNRPSRRDNTGRSSEGRPTTPIPDYTLEQPSRNRRIHQDPTERPPPYQTYDPNRRPSREELEARAFAHVHAQAHADARAEYLMRQRSRDYDPGWYGTELDDIHEHPAMIGPAVVDPGMIDPAMMDPAMIDPAIMDPAMMDPGMMDPYYQSGAFP